VFLLDERVFMNLGILKVAAVLEERGFEVESVDLSGISNHLDAIRDHAESTPARIFGLTTTTPQLPAAKLVCETIRDVRPDARIVLGGPHVTLVNAARKREEKLKIEGRARKAFRNLGDLADVLVAGDGEDAAPLAMKEDAPKLIDADDPKSALFMNNARYEASPFPSRHLVDVDSYRYKIDGVRALSLIAQLGCPFACGFCGGRESPFLRRVRMRSSQNIIREIEALYTTYGAKGFMLYDDELNVSPNIVQLMDGISDLQDKLGVEFRLRGFIKAELFNDEQAKAMRRAGFRWILTGFESGSPRVLENMNKRATREDNTRCVELARKHDLKVKALMSLGHPGESDKTVSETKDWLLQVRPDDFDVTIITTYPGSPYYDYAVPHPDKPGIYAYTYKKTGDRLYSHDVDYSEVADYYKGDPDGGYKAFVYTEHLSEEDLVRHRDDVERSVRKELSIPFNPSAAARNYEHSMGQLPTHILRKSTARPAVNLKAPSS
jgi:radical SAM superfamily enzyme YgiQ (UPF0313 family)